MVAPMGVTFEEPAEKRVAPAARIPNPREVGIRTSPVKDYC